MIDVGRTIKKVMIIVLGFMCIFEIVEQVLVCWGSAVVCWGVIIYDFNKASN